MAGGRFRTAERPEKERLLRLGDVDEEAVIQRTSQETLMYVRKLKADKILFNQRASTHSFRLFEVRWRTFPELRVAQCYMSRCRFRLRMRFGKSLVQNFNVQAPLLSDRPWSHNPSVGRGTPSLKGRQQIGCLFRVTLVRQSKSARGGSACMRTGRTVGSAGFPLVDFSRSRMVSLVNRIGNRVGSVGKAPLVCETQRKPSCRTRRDFEAR